MGAREIEQRTCQPGDFRAEVEQPLARVQAQGTDHLVVARTSRVYLLAGLPRPPGQEPLQGGVAVLLVIPNSEPAGVDFGKRLPQRIPQRGELGRLKDADRAEHLGVREAGDRVGLQQLPVMDAIVADREALDGRIKMTALVPELGPVPQLGLRSAHDAPSSPTRATHTFSIFSVASAAASTWSELTPLVVSVSPSPRHVIVHCTIASECPPGGMETT